MLHYRITIDYGKNISKITYTSLLSAYNRSVENQIKMAGFPARKTFELYDFDFQPNLDTDMIDDLRTLRFIGNNENIIFLGTPGVGKTHLAIALGISAI